jgi:hypothetical protein
VGLAVLVTTYLAAVVVAALLDSRSDGLRERLWLVVVLPTLHLSYGAGYLRGGFDLAIGRSPAAGRDLVPTR